MFEGRLESRIQKKGGGGRKEKKGGSKIEGLLDMNRERPRCPEAGGAAMLRIDLVLLSGSKSRDNTGRARMALYCLTP